MRADVYQVVAIACQGTLFLKGKTQRVPELLGHDATFDPVHELMFDRAGPGNQRTMIAEATGPWLRRLQKEGVERLCVSLQSCPIDPNSGSAEPWGIIADGDIGVEIWQPHWHKRIRTYSDPAPWRVQYSASRTSRSTANPLTSLAFAVKEIQPFQNLALIDDPMLKNLLPEDFPEDLARIGKVALGLLQRARNSDNPQTGLWRAGLRALESVLNVEWPAWERSTLQDLKLPA